MTVRGIILGMVCLCAAVPATAQTLSSPDENELSEAVSQQQQPVRSSQPETRPGQTAKSSAGRAGQRQTREAAQGVKPMTRVSNRINNRVQSRIRNRIDRHYDPQANAVSPFAVAEEQTRTAQRR